MHPTKIKKTIHASQPCQTNMKTRGFQHVVFFEILESGERPEPQVSQME
jgi:hypothetical protein